MSDKDVFFIMIDLKVPSTYVSKSGLLNEMIISI